MSDMVKAPDGLELAVFTSGNPDGPTLLLVHGYPDTHEVWDEVCAELAEEFRLVRYDVRGAGRSGTPADRPGYELSRLADDLFAVVDWIGGPVHLVAHDWGSIQSWHAVTDPRAAARILSFTSVSGPSLDHVGRWFRRRLTRPTPRHLAEFGRQAAMSWYVGAFQIPALAPFVWRVRLARRWAAMLRAVEGVAPRPGHPADTLLRDAINGIELYRANMFRRIGTPQVRRTDVPVQVVMLTRDHYVSPALTHGLEELAPALTRRTLDATHWSALTVQAAELAGLVRDFTLAPPSAPAPAKPLWDKVAVITGAGSGIGRATAFALAERGARVIACDIDLQTAERTAELAGLMGSAASAYRVDVSDDAAMTEFAAQVIREHGVPDIVVNNAGVGHVGGIIGTSEAEWRRLLGVNLWGVIHGSRVFGRPMADSGRGGHIVNVASAAAYMPSKTLGAYATTKAAVSMLSDSLRAELASSKVRVSVIYPGIVNTNITRTTTVSGASPEELKAQRARAVRIYGRRNYPPEKVAEQIAEAIVRNRGHVAVTPEAKLALVISRVWPAGLRAFGKLNLG